METIIGLIIIFFVIIFVIKLSKKYELFSKVIKLIKLLFRLLQRTISFIIKSPFLILDAIEKTKKYKDDLQDRTKEVFKKDDFEREKSERENAQKQREFDEQLEARKEERKRKKEELEDMQKMIQEATKIK